MTVYFAGSKGLDIACDIRGHWAHPLVVLLHGGGQTRMSWGSAASTLAKKGFLTVTVDARGHGDSAWDPDTDYSMEAHVDDLRCLLAQLGKPAALVGASLGGLTSMLAAGEAPTLDLTAIVLVDITPRMQTSGRTAITDFMGANPDGFASVEEAADSVSAYLPHRPRPSDNSGLRKNLRQHENGRWYWHWDPQMLLPENTSKGKGGDPKRFEAALANVTVPTLLVRGKSSELIGQDEVDAFRATAPHAEYVDLPGAAHMVAGDRNDVFADTVVEFLERTVLASA